MPTLYLSLKNQTGGYMGIFKSLDLPKKEPGAILNTADRQYLIKLVIITGFVTASVSICGTMFLLERHIDRMGNKAKVMMEWSKKADRANNMLSDIFKVERIKQSYEKQGIKVDETIIK